MNNKPIHNEIMDKVIKELERSFGDIYDIAPIAYWYEYLNESGRLTEIHFSKRMREMLGYSSLEEFPDELESFTRSVHPDDLSRVLDNVIAAGTGKVDRYEAKYRIQKADGEYMWCKATGKVVHDECGNIVGMYGAFIDISADVELQRIKDEETEKLIEGLLKNYNLVYRVNISDASFSLLKIDKGIIGEGMTFADFTEARDFFINQVAYSSDRPNLRKEMDFDRIRERLSVEPKYSTEYRAVVGGVAVWHEMVISQLDGDDIAMGFAIKDVEVLNRHISQTLLNSYEGIYVINLNTDQVKILKSTGVKYDISKVISSKDFLKVLIDKLDNEAREYFSRMADSKYLKQLLYKEGRTEFYYLSPSYEEGHVWLKCETYALTYANDMPETAVVGITKADSIQRERIELNEKLATALHSITEEKKRFEVAADLINSANWSFKIDKNDEVVDAEFFGEPIKILGVDLQITPHAWEELIHPDDKEKTMKAFNAAIKDHKGKTPYDVVYRMKDRNGKYNWFRSAGRIIRQDDGSREFFGIHINVNDRIEEEQRYQKTLQEALSDAKKANEAKSNFLFSMSHDIRTPMNAILGFTGMAQKHLGDLSKVNDWLDKIQQSGNLLLSLINSVLDMSRIESGNVEKDEKEGDVYYSFANIESTMRETAATKDIDIDFEFGTITDRYVYADFNRCIRIFTNLISNAIKYTNPGGHVLVKCEQASPKKDGTVLYKYTIADNGIGMSKEFQEKMYESFSREQNSTTSGIQGTGLGLSVCKSFVDYLNGTIECDSKPGVGTTFTLYLPFRVQEGRQYTDPLSGQVMTNEPNKALLKVSFKGRKLLLVEDNELNREIAKSILEDEQIEVDEAEDGYAAIDIIRKNGPRYYDFILMDIQMPKMNGYEATKAIRKMYPDDNIPVIALSANAFNEDREQALEAGMNDHIAKPINCEEMFAVLAKFI